MSMLMLEEPAADAQTAGPVSSAAQKFIIEHAADVDVPPNFELEGLGLDSMQFVVLAQRWEARREAIEVALPEGAALTEEAAKIVIPPPTDPGTVMVESCLTIADLDHALRQLQEGNVVPSREKLERHELLRQAAALRVPAMSTLATTVSQEHKRKVLAANDVIRSAEKRIAADEDRVAHGERMQSVLDAKDKIVRERDRVSGPARLQQIEVELSRFPVGTIRDAKKAVKRIAADHKVVAKQRAQLEKLQPAIFDLNNMDWSVD